MFASSKFEGNANKGSLHQQNFGSDIPAKKWGLPFASPLSPFSEFCEGAGEMIFL
jgi:hypothetical protein